MYDFNMINTVSYVHHLGYDVISGRAKTSFSGYILFLAATVTLSNPDSQITFYQYKQTPILQDKIDQVIHKF
jgi:hypothetical protein